MSITKRHLEGPRSPAEPEAIRQVIDAHTFPLRGKRKNPDGPPPLWDPHYANALHKAQEQLGISGINVNGALRFRTAAERDAVKERTEKLCAEARAAFAARRTLPQ